MCVITSCPEGGEVQKILTANTKKKKFFIRKFCRWGWDQKSRKRPDVMDLDAAFFKYKILQNLWSFETQKFFFSKSKNILLHIVLHINWSLKKTFVNDVCKWKFRNPSKIDLRLSRRNSQTLLTSYHRWWFHQISPMIQF